MNNIYKERLYIIIDELVPVEELSIENKFAIIGSNSIKATLFLTAIEDEFDTEIDDNLITSKFFSDIDYLLECIVSK